MSHAAPSPPVTRREVSVRARGDVSITIELTEKQVEDALAEAAAEACAGVHVPDIVTAEVTKYVQSKLDEMSTKLLEARIATELDAIIAEGWQPTTDWGEPKGARMTLRGRVCEALQGSFTSGRGEAKSWVQRAMCAEVERLAAELAAEIRAEVSEWRATELVKKVRAAIDGELTGK